MQKVFISLLFILCAQVSMAQDVAPVDNQNPNYKVSLVKYQTTQENLSGNMNTTVQNTYKAYDWTEAKEAQKKDRIARRQERALARINNRSYFPDYLFWSPNCNYNRY